MTERNEIREKLSDDKRELTIAELDAVTGGWGAILSSCSTLASIQKVAHDTNNAVIGKI